MIGGSTAQEVGRVVRLSTISCFVAAVIAIVVASIAGHAVVGAELAIGIVLGAANAHMTQRLLRVEMPFMATSLFRILTLMAVAGVIGLLIGLNNVWLIVAGLGVAQLIQSASAVREIKR